MLERPADSELLIDQVGPLGANEPVQVREQDVAVVTDPVRLVEAMLARGVDARAVDQWIPERIMVCVTEVLTQLRGRAKANAIIAAILSCTAGMEGEMGVVVRDIGRIRVQKG